MMVRNAKLFPYEGRIASEWLTVILRVFQKGSQEKIDKIGR
jgi:hypothetical protein